MLPKGLNPSDDKPSLTLSGPKANSGYRSSNSFHASPSAGCLSTPSFVRLSACYFMCEAVFCDINNLCNLGFKGNHHKTFFGFLFDICDESSPPFLVCFHFEASHLVHLSSFSLSFQNSIQPLGYAGIFSYPSPKSFMNFLASHVSLGSFASEGTISLRNPSNLVNEVLLHPPSHFRLKRPTIALNMLCFVHPDHNGSSVCFNKSTC
jgi:hypothetical protein